MSASPETGSVARGGRPVNAPDVIERLSEPEPNTGCWLWIAQQVNGYYGRVRYRGRKLLAHRLAYTLAVGPIPEGLEVDHRCRQMRYVNPAHLRLVTPEENKRLAREAGSRPPLVNRQRHKTHCPRGHAYDGIGKRGTGHTFRYCKTCDNARTLRRYHERRAAS